MTDGGHDVDIWTSPLSCCYGGKVKISHQVVAFNNCSSAGVSMLEASGNANVRSALRDHDASIPAAHQTGGFSGRRRTAGTGDANTPAVVDG